MYSFKKKIKKVICLRLSFRMGNFSYLLVTVKISSISKNGKKNYLHIILMYNIEVNMSTLYSKDNTKTIMVNIDISTEIIFADAIFCLSEHFLSLFRVFVSAFFRGFLTLNTLIFTKDKKHM